jgi:type IV pilus assembly protein PilV
MKLHGLNSWHCRSSETRLPRPRSVTGFTLVEILVTVVIMSVGLLGIAALHTASLRNNLDSALRSHASALAADIADRMRSNRSAALAGQYNIALAASVTVTASSPLADRDKNAWKTLLAQVLPNGDGSVTRSGNVFTITIQWGERVRQGETDPDLSTPFVVQTFVTRTQI